MQQNVKPAFEVEILEGTIPRQVVKMVDGEMSTEIIDEPRGYMVYFPSGHSIRVRNHKDLVSLGFEKAPNLVDMDNGDELTLHSHRSLKSEVERKTKPTRAKKQELKDE